MSVRRLFVVLLALLAAACSDGNPPAAPEETVVAETTTSTAPVITAAPTTARPTTTATTLRPTTTSSTMLAMGPGDASIVGTVRGNAGGVEGAIVRVERLVGKAVVSTDVITSGGGTYAVATILGGSYRVRALKPPDFALSPV
ncbi:MAG: hypothetical protein Q8K72_12015, partial [Acidimicrobiales bacterium]|nr:hypothetical protein [Acidimicrobiales bacterium]